MFHEGLSTFGCSHCLGPLFGDRGRSMTMGITGKAEKHVTAKLPGLRLCISWWQEVRTWQSSTAGPGAVLC